MSLVSWDQEGIELKEREVKKFIQEQGLSFCGLIESKVKECNKEGVGLEFQPTI